MQQAFSNERLTSAFIHLCTFLFASVLTQLLIRQASRTYFGIICCKQRLVLNLVEPLPEAKGLEMSRSVQVLLSRTDGRGG